MLTFIQFATLVRSVGRNVVTRQLPNLSPIQHRNFTVLTTAWQSRQRNIFVTSMTSSSSSSNGGISMSSSTGNGTAEVTMARARHILVDSEDMIDAIRSQLDEGKGSFEELAKLVSKCPSKARGGDLGWFKRNVMVKDFENAVFDNQPGSILKIKTDFGWHLILVEGHGKASAPISVQEFAVRFVKDPSDDLSSVQLIDCREPSELEQASLPGFLNLPMGEYDRWADDFDNGNFNLDKDKETVVMCHHGVRSANFCSFLSQKGFTKARNLVGGIDAYSKEIDPSVPTY